MTRYVDPLLPSRDRRRTVRWQHRADVALGLAVGALAAGLVLVEVQRRWMR